MDQHFGHCERFALIDVAPKNREMTAEVELAAPEHDRGLLLRWLKERDVTHVIANGMWAHARSLLHEGSIEVVPGAPPGERRLPRLRW